MHRQTVLCLILAVFCSSAGAAEPPNAAPTAPTSRPNVILCMADDLGWGDTGYNGNEVIRTPHLDAMAAEGVRFDRFYAAAPVCSPTRGSSLTGRHPFRYGIYTANAGHMKSEEVTLAEVLRTKGYTTGHFGKWHLGTLTTTVTESNRGGPRGADHYSPPWENGFDVCFSTEAKVPTWDPMRRPRKASGTGWEALGPGDDSIAYGTHYWDGRGSIVTENLEGDDSRVIMDRVVPFITKAARSGTPFLAVVWFHAPHLPVVAGPKYAAMYSDHDLYERNYYGCVTALDEQMGRLRATLEELGVAGNTMLWFASDNGPEGRTGRAPGSAGPFSGRKRSLREGGVRVPGLLVWPDGIAGTRRISMPCSTSDYVPTVLAALGHTTPELEARPRDGIDLLPALSGAMTERPRPLAFQSGSQLALSDNRYKIYSDDGGERFALYDLTGDPSESRDLAKEKPELVGRMAATLKAWQASCEASRDGEDYATPPGRPNVLLLTVDDMSADSVGVFGCEVPGTTPNIDRLAGEGMRFVRAHVNVAVCQPCRGALATGRYPHRSGLEGFFRLPDRSIPTVHEVLRGAGYLVGKMGKGAHADPKAGFAWDLSTEDLGYGRDPAKYYEHALRFIEEAKAAGKPFYLNANSHDPHRPFSGSDQERRRQNWQSIAAPSRTYAPGEVVVPKFLPDLPEVRREIAEYYSSVRRADDTVGAVLRALDDAGARDDTLVVFLSDHGMPLPFSKTNCYFHSTRTPWIVRWPGKVKPGAVDEKHFISTIDFLPTVLEAAGVECPVAIDGTSFLPLLRGESQGGRELVFTQFHETSARRRYPMRCVQNGRYGYIFNPWADGMRVFRNESQSGRTFAAMQRAAADDAEIARRVDLFVHRVPEELYDFRSDPDALVNLIDDPKHRPQLDALRAELLEWMERTGDPALAAFRNRGSKEAWAAFMAAEEARVEARAPRKNSKKNEKKRSKKRAQRKRT